LGRSPSYNCNEKNLNFSVPREFGERALRPTFCYKRVAGPAGVRDFENLNVSEKRPKTRVFYEKILCIQEIFSCIQKNPARAHGIWRGSGETETTKRGSREVALPPSAARTHKAWPEVRPRKNFRSCDVVTGHPVFLPQHPAKRGKRHGGHVIRGKNISKASRHRRCASLSPFLLPSLLLSRRVCSAAAVRATRLNGQDTNTELRRMGPHFG